MNSRTRTLASLFSVAMAAMLLGAVATTQMRSQAAAQGPVSPNWPASDNPMRSAVSQGSGAVTLDTFRDIARAQTPGVVNINTSKVVKRSRMRDPFRDFFGDDMMERFFGPQVGPERQTQRSLGSGFVVDKEGYILTNRHVVEGADNIRVTLANGRRTYDAKLVGKDARTDVALLKIEPKESLTALQLGDSDRTEVGEWVMAIGNPFGLGGNSVTVGVVSFKGQRPGLGGFTRGTSVDLIQTDAAINPGNSGGPLINTRGEVVGVNTLIVTGGLQQSAGVGFAVAVNVAKEVLPQLRAKGKVIRGWLGVSIQSMDEDLAKTYRLKEPAGAVVTDVTRDGPADKAGLRPEDVVIDVDGHKVQDNADLSRYVASKAPGTTVRLRVLRGGAEKDVSVSLGTFPEESASREEMTEQGQTKLGMQLHDLTPSMAERLEVPPGTRGVLVMEVEAGTSAEEAGLRRGDVIVKVNGAQVTTVDEFESEVSRAKADGVARLSVRRGDGQFVTTLRLD
jgi:serine protease Do